MTIRNIWTWFKTKEQCFTSCTLQKETREVPDFKSLHNVSQQFCHDACDEKWQNDVENRKLWMSNLRCEEDMLQPRKQKQINKHILQFRKKKACQASVRTLSSYKEGSTRQPNTRGLGNQSKWNVWQIRGKTSATDQSSLSQTHTRWCPNVFLSSSESQKKKTMNKNGCRCVWRWWVLDERRNSNTKTKRPLKEKGERDWRRKEEPGTGIGREEKRSVPSAGSRTLLQQRTHTHAHKIKTTHAQPHTHSGGREAAATKCHSPAGVPSRSRQPGQAQLWLTNKKKKKEIPTTAG